MMTRTLLRRVSSGRGYVVEWRTPAMRATAFVCFPYKREAREFRDALLHDQLARARTEKLMRAGHLYALPWAEERQRKALARMTWGKQRRYPAAAFRVLTQAPCTCPDLCLVHPPGAELSHAGDLV